MSRLIIPLLCAVLCLCALPLLAAEKPSVLSAVSEANMPLLEQILTADPAQIKAVDEYGCTVLYYALFQYKPDLIKYLLEKNADPNVAMKGFRGMTILHLLADNDPKREDRRAAQLESLKLLLARGADPARLDEAGETPLHTVAGKRGADNEYFLAILRLLLTKAKVDTPAADGRTPLHEAAIKNNVAVARHLLDNGADIKARTKTGRTPLHCAAMYFIYLTIVTDKNGKQTTTTDVAQRAELIELLVARGAELNARNAEGLPPIAIAVQASLETTKAVLSFKPDLQYTGKDGDTLAHLAAGNKNGEGAEVLALLTERGLPVNGVDANKQTPLFYAAATKNCTAVKWLAEKGLDLTARDAYGKTLLHIAAGASFNKTGETVQYLIGKGLDMKAVDKAGRTLLHEAASTGDVEMVKFLLTQGLDTNAKDNDGKTPLQLAQEMRRKNVVQVLVPK